MVRTQIQLTADQSRRLKSLAVRRKTSVAELIRLAVNVVLDREIEPTPEERIARAIQAAGRHRSSHRDVARRHDEYLDQAYSSTAS